MVRVELSRLVLNERSEEQVVCLREMGGGREFPIVIGLFEALAIDRLLKEMLAERPLTHDLLAAVLNQLEARLEYVLIDDLRDETYYAKLVLQRDERQVTVDARPSDALALALKEEVPIFVADRVMNTVCSS